MNTEKEEKLIGELMAKSSSEMPFADFEEKLMEQVFREEKNSRSFLKNVKLSWFFFIIGTAFGLVISTILGQMDTTILGFPSQRVVLIAQTIFVILLLSQFDKLIELTRKRN
ncbi:MAG: hypothetical protein RBS73_15615 [Prolixibacteraceae bacterium]|jgi:hypothetical protein|nr:hypothetical protein [Prolixibacteraceae bacterium]